MRLWQVDEKKSFMLIEVSCIIWGLALLEATLNQCPSWSLQNRDSLSDFPTVNMILDQRRRQTIMREYRYYLINWPSWQNNRVILPRRENLPVKTEPSILKHTPALDASAFQLASHGAIVMRSTEHRKHAHNKPVLSGPCYWQRDKRNVCMRTQISEH